MPQRASKIKMGSGFRRKDEKKAMASAGPKTPIPP